MKRHILFGFVCIVSLLSSLPVFAGTFTIPDWVMKSCVFVMRGDKAVGTGFLIGVEEQEKTFCYFVTAKHVIPTDVKNIPVLRLRLNKKDGAELRSLIFQLLASIISYGLSMIILLLILL
ncbi:MAG: hypothetical protein GY846_26870 [Deltaproteobacteria bacterium]|nr:hypothetical protein [Deltaproteobacteria bacterium]